MSTQFHLTDKTILVTGASSGIGKQVAITCSEMGATLCISGKNRARLGETFEQLKGSNHKQYVCNLVEENERNNFIDTMPAIDGFVHCAGIVNPTPVKFIEERHIRKMMDINFNAATLIVSRLLKTKKINKDSSLVFMSSIGAHFPYNGGALYNASKAAIEAYSRNIAREMSSSGIRSNCIVPAMVNTPMYEETLSGLNMTAEEYEAKYPLGIGKPEDIANAAVFLLSKASRWITGTTISMDGGYTSTVL